MELVTASQIELRPVFLSEEYRVKWNCGHMNDFVNIYLDGIKVSDTLYRVGGIGGRFVDGYIMLLKHTEAFYEDSITKDPKRKPHLKDQWCILNDSGIEKVVFRQFASPYLKGGVVYVLDNKYYNIETGEKYCNSYTSMSSDEFIFLDNAYDDDKSRRGVMKINKKDGTFEIFKSKK